jgi:hypothetical protein
MRKDQRQPLGGLGSLAERAKARVSHPRRLQVVIPLMAGMFTFSSTHHTRL